MTTPGNSARWQAPAAAGVILIDLLRRPVHYNAEAVAILSYPRQTEKLDNLPDLLARDVRSFLGLAGGGNGEAQFLSGRRHYVCRAFGLVQHGAQPELSGLTALLLERTAAKSLDVSQAAERFRLSEREQQAVGLLTLGLTSKEIATRMNISPNTVKVFLRLVMTKMAVTTRSGIVGKIVRL